MNLQEFKEVIDKKTLVTASVVMLFMFAMLLALLVTKKTTQQDTRSSARTLYPAKVYLGNKGVTKVADGNVSIDVYIDVDNQKVSAASIPLKYPAALYEIIEDAPVSDSCKADGFKLDNLAKVDANNPGIVLVTRVTLAEDKDLPTGKFCFGTVTFRVKANLDEEKGADNTVKVDNSASAMEIVGPGVKYNYQIVPDKAKANF